MKCGWKGGDCGDVDADAATWRPPTLAEERHDERHLLLPLHRRRNSSQMGCSTCSAGSQMLPSEAGVGCCGTGADAASWQQLPTNQGAPSPEPMAAATATMNATARGRSCMRSRSAFQQSLPHSAQKLWHNSHQSPMADVVSRSG